MKKASVEKLEADGWELPKDYKDKVAVRQSTKSFNEAAESIAKSMGEISRTVKSISADDAQRKTIMSSGLVVNSKILEELKNAKALPWTKIDFDVIRKNGVIDKVIVTRIK